MFGVFVDTLVICSATAAIILSSGALDHAPGTISGIELTQRALASSVGGWGSIFIATAIFFFGFTSIIANYSYAESNLVFLEHNHPAGLMLFRCCTLGMVMFGTLAELPLVWKMADLSMAMMAITNLIAILLLSGVALKLAKDYNHQRSIGRLPTFDISQYPEIQQQVEPGIWDKPKSE